MPSNCKECNAADATSICGACKSVYYCTKKCQIKHWKHHKKVCNVPQKNEVKHTNPTVMFKTIPDEDIAYFKQQFDAERILVGIAGLELNSIHFSFHSSLAYYIAWDENSRRETGKIAFLCFRDCDIAAGENIMPLKAGSLTVMQFPMKAIYESHLENTGVSIPWKQNPQQIDYARSRRADGLRN